MATQMTNLKPSTAHLDVWAWVKTGFVAAAVSIVAVLSVQALALTLFPQAAAFKPLDSYARSALFVLAPALAATALFAWLTQRVAKPATRFIALAAIVLLVSLIPDYVLPDPHKTLLASTLAALLHVVAGSLIVPILVLSYQRQRKHA